MSNKTINDLYDFLRNNGMIGGKLVGAGGGGLDILAVCDDARKLQHECGRRNIITTQVTPDYNGVQTLERTGWGYT